LGRLDSLLHFADHGQILVELPLVLRTESSLKVARLVEHEVEDAPLRFLADRKILLPLALFAGAKQPLEHQPRIRLGADARSGRAPSEVVLIRAGVAGVATP